MGTGLFCPECGERRLDAQAPVRAAAARTWWRRLRASINALAAPPGRLTRDWIDGRRVAYLPPLSLLLWINVAFFLVQSASGISILSWPLRVHLDNEILGLATPLMRWHRAARTTETDAAFIAAFGALESVHAKSLVVVMVPLLAAALQVVARRPRRRFADALAFSSHFFAYALIFLSALFPLVALTLASLAHGGLRPSTSTMDEVVTAIELALCAWYLYRALGTAFGGSAWLRAAQTLALLLALAAILRLYHLAVFALTLAAA